jgi:hypothetical protein
MDQESSFKNRAEQAMKEATAGLKKLVEIDGLLRSISTLPVGEVLAETIHPLAEMEHKAVMLLQSSTKLQRTLLLEQKEAIEELYGRIDK